MNDGRDDMVACNPSVYEKNSEEDGDDEMKFVPDQQINAISNIINKWQR